MKILIKRSFVEMKNLTSYQQGKEYDVVDKDAINYISVGHAEKIETKVKKVTEEKIETEETEVKKAKPKRTKKVEK